MKHLIKVQGSKMDKEREHDLYRKMQGCEVNDLRSMLRGLVDEDDIVALLAQSVPEKREYTEPVRAKPVKGARNSKRGDDMSRESLLQKARDIRANIGLAKKRIPDLKGKSNKEILEMCDQFEELANDPEKLKMMNESRKNMSDEDIRKYQEVAQKVQADAAASGKEPSQMEIIMAMRKENPGMFKKLMKKNMGSYGGGMTDDQLDSMLKNMEGMSDEQLRSTLSMGETAQTYFKKIDQATGGNGKIALGVGIAILLIILIVVLYYVFTTVWFYSKGFLGFGGTSSNTGETYSTPQGEEFESSGKASTEYDEF